MISNKMISKKRKLIEEAVVELRGEWPKTEEGNILVRGDESGELWLQYAYELWGDETEICIRAEFEHAVKDFKYLYSRLVHGSFHLSFDEWIKSDLVNAIVELARDGYFNWRTPLPSEQEKPQKPYNGFNVFRGHSLKIKFLPEESMPSEQKKAANLPLIGSEWRHRNGNIYTVTGYANEHSESDKYPVTIIYQGANNGNTWCRPASDWGRSMTPLSERDKLIVEAETVIMDKCKLEPIKKHIECLIDAGWRPTKD